LNKSTQQKVQNLLRNPACCRESGLLRLAEQLKKQGLTADSQEIQELVVSMAAKAKKLAKKSVSGPVSKHLSGAPREIDKYYESCFKRYKNKEYCARVAWAIYCQHVNPQWSGCGASEKKSG
jgi:hypothetical protein